MLSDPDNRAVDVFEFGTGISLSQQISIRFDHIAALGGATRLEGGIAVLNFILEARHGRRGVGSGGVNRHPEETCQYEHEQVGAKLGGREHVRCLPNEGGGRQAANPLSETPYSAFRRVRFRGRGWNPRAKPRRRALPIRNSLIPLRNPPFPGRNRANTPRNLLSTPRNRIKTPRSCPSTPRSCIVTARSCPSTPRNRIITPRSCVSTARNRVITARRRIITPRRQVVTARGRPKTPRDRVVTAWDRDTSVVGAVYDRPERPTRPVPGASRSEGFLLSDLNRRCVGARAVRVVKR